MATRIDMSKNVLITGAAGFIGFHLALELSRRGDQVLGLDNFNDYYATPLKRKRAAILEQQHIRIVEGDCCHFEPLQELVNQHKISHFVHLAAQAGVRYSLQNPQAYVKANLEGFVNVLESCVKSKYPGVKLTYASSSSVYGLNETTPFSVQDRTDKQASLYGVTKKTNELMAQTYHHLYGLPVTGLRFFTVYGPWGRPDMAYYSFAAKMMKGEPIEIYNHGKMERDFTYIDDIVNGIVAAIDLGAPCELFNLGNNRPEPLSKLIASLEKELGVKAIQKSLPMQSGDVLTTYADISHSQEKLRYRPSTSLENGIASFAAWFKDYHRTI
jgi:UDP-glucuronate 4-epimerase